MYSAIEEYRTIPEPADSAAKLRCTLDICGTEQERLVTMLKVLRNAGWIHGSVTGIA